MLLYLVFVSVAFVLYIITPRVSPLRVKNVLLTYLNTCEMILSGPRQFICIVKLFLWYRYLPTFYRLQYSIPFKHFEKGGLMYSC